MNNATNNISFSMPSSPAPTIAREDFVQAGLCLLAADDASRMVKGYARNPKAIGSAFLFQELRAGKGGEYFASLRQSVYDAARDAGYTVNTRSNTVGVLTSNAATVADSPHRDAVLREASNFAQAVKLAKEAKNAAEDAKVREETEREAVALLATMTADERIEAARAQYAEACERIAETFGLSIADFTTKKPAKRKKA
jgi:hypothetical protein